MPRFGIPMWAEASLTVTVEAADYGSACVAARAAMAGSASFRKTVGGPMVTVDSFEVDPTLYMQDGQIVTPEAPGPTPGQVELQAAAERVRRYIDGRRAIPHLDAEDVHGVFVHREDEPRELTVSDLMTLLAAVPAARP